MTQVDATGRPIGGQRGYIARALRAMQRGQAMVEFGFIATLAIMLLLIGIQLAVIGQADLAVGQLAYFGARYAAVNYTEPTDNVVSTMINNASPTISKYLTTGEITVTCSNPTDCTPPRQMNQTVTISINYDATKNLVLPKTFLGLTFPTNLSAQETMMSE
jgi:Flp pilus assembly protein TadG